MDAASSATDNDDVDRTPRRRAAPRSEPRVHRDRGHRRPAHVRPDRRDRERRSRRRGRQDDRRRRWVLPLRILVSRRDAGHRLHTCAGLRLAGHRARVVTNHALLVGRRSCCSPRSRSCSRRVRWQQVLHAIGLHGPTAQARASLLRGQFVSNVLPTTIGGDVLRVSRLSAENGDRPTPSHRSCSNDSPVGWCSRSSPSSVS